VKVMKLIVTAMFNKVIKQELNLLQVQTVELAVSQYQQYFEYKRIYVSQ
jgi:hypothetical protein